MKVGSRVRVIADEHPEMVGAVGRIQRFSPDGTTAVVRFYIDVWCSVSNLEEV